MLVVGKNMIRTTFLMLFMQAVWAVSSLAAGNDLALPGKWICWNVEQNAPSTNGLLTIEFRPNEVHDANMLVVIWGMLIDGKKITRHGTFAVERSANLFHPQTTTHIVIIKPMTTDYPREMLIPLVDVRITEDNRFPSGTIVLKFRDGFNSEFVLKRDANRLTKESTVP